MAAPVIAIAAGHSHSVALTKAGGIAHPSPPIPTLITDPCYVTFVCWKKWPLQFARIKDVALYV